MSRRPVCRKIEIEVVISEARLHITANRPIRDTYRPIGSAPKSIETVVLYLPTRSTCARTFLMVLFLVKNHPRPRRYYSPVLFCFVFTCITIEELSRLDQHMHVRIGPTLGLQPYSRVSDVIMQLLIARRSCVQTHTQEFCLEGIDAADEVWQTDVAFQGRRSSLSHRYIMIFFRVMQIYRS